MCCSDFSVQHELLCSLETVALQYSCREKRDVNFFKSAESVNGFTIMVVKRSSISEFKHSSRMTSCIASTSGRAVVNDIPPQYKHSSQ